MVAIEPVSRLRRALSSAFWLYPSRVGRRTETERDKRVFEGEFNDQRRLQAPLQRTQLVIIERRKFRGDFDPVMDGVFFQGIYRIRRRIAKSSFRGERVKSREQIIPMPVLDNVPLF